MKKVLSSLLLFFCIASNIQSQVKRNTYLQFDVAASITQNSDYDSSASSFIIPDGTGAKIGYGIHYNKWVTLGIHSGIDWQWDSKLVAIPVFLNFGLNPKVGRETRIMMHAGYGKGFAIGRNNLSGEYGKLKLGIGADDVALFAEVAAYHFPFNDEKSVGNISLGVSLIDFFHYK